MSESMPSSFNEKWAAATARLVALTQSGELSWAAHEPSDQMAPDLKGRAHRIFIASHLNKPLRVYEERVEPDEEADEVPRGITFSDAAAAMAAYLLAKPPRQPRLHLELCGFRWVGEWEVPYSSALPDLLSAILYRASGAANFLEALLREAPGQSEVRPKSKPKDGEGTNG